MEKEKRLSIAVRRHGKQLAGIRHMLADCMGELPDGGPFEKDRFRNSNVGQTLKSDPHLGRKQRVSSLANEVIIRADGVAPEQSALELKQLRRQLRVVKRILARP